MDLLRIDLKRQPPSCRVDFARERDRHHEATGQSGLGQFAAGFSKLARPVCVVPFFESYLRLPGILLDMSYVLSGFVLHKNRGLKGFRKSAEGGKMEVTKGSYWWPPPSRSIDALHRTEAPESRGNGRDCGGNWAFPRGYASTIQAGTPGAFSVFLRLIERRGHLSCATNTNWRYSHRAATVRRSESAQPV